MKNSPYLLSLILLSICPNQHISRLGSYYSNLIVLTDQDGNSVRFELLDIVEYKEDEYAVLYPADGGDDEPVHILRIISENLDVNEAEFEGLDDDELIDTIYQIFRERNDLDD